MASLEAGLSGVRNPRKLTREQVLEDGDGDDDFDDSGTSPDSDNEQTAVGSRSDPVPSQDESRSSSTSDEAEIAVDQFGWRIVSEDQQIKHYDSNPQFFSFPEYVYMSIWKRHSNHYDCSNKVHGREMGLESLLFVRSY